MNGYPENDTAQPDAPSVLVVDDEPMVRRVLVAMLGRLGATAVGVESGEEALALMRAGQAFSAVILDLSMPGLSGADTFRELRVLAPGLPVIICSGYAPASSLDHELAATVAGMVRKPFAPDELRRVLVDAGVLPAQG